MKGYRERGMRWKLLIAETSEDYLGVAEKQSGDSVIIIISGSDSVSTIRVEPREEQLVPCSDQ